MALADLLIQQVGQTAQKEFSPDIAGAVKSGVELATHIEQVAQQRESIEQKKKEFEQAKLQSFGESVSKIKDFKDPAARSGYVKFLQSQNKVLKLGIPDESLQFAFSGNENIARVGTLVTMVNEGVISGPQGMAILSDPKKFSDIVPQSKYQGPSFEGADFSGIDIKESSDEIAKASAQRQANLSQERKSDSAAGQRGISNLTELRKEVTSHPVSKTTFEIASSYDKIRRATEKPSAAGDMTLIYNFMKMQDPGSTVREGEFKSAETTAGIPEQILQVRNKLLSGERLTPTQRKDFYAQSEGLYRDQYKKQEEVNREFEGIARQTGLEPKLIFAGTKFKAPPEDKKKAPPTGDWRARAKATRDTFSRLSPGDKKKVINALATQNKVTPEEVSKELGE